MKQRVGDSTTFFGTGDTSTLHDELIDLKKRFAFLAGVTKSNLEKIHLAVDAALREQQTDRPLPVWSKGKDDALHEIVEIVERAEQDVQLASTSLKLSLPLDTLEDNVVQPVFGSVNSSVNDSKKNKKDGTAFESEVVKAYQLARVMQERNLLKEKCMKAEEASVVIQQRLEALIDEHNRLLQALTCCSQGVDSDSEDKCATVVSQGNITLEAMREAMRQRYEHRVRELEEELVSAKEELRLRKTGSGDGTTSNPPSSWRLREDDGVSELARTSLTCGERDMSMEDLRRQNIFFRNKLKKLKEELNTSQKASIGSAEQLNEGLEGLLKTISELQTGLLAKERQRMDAESAQKVAKREAQQLAARVEEMERQMTRLQHYKTNMGLLSALPQRGDQLSADAVELHNAVMLMEHDKMEKLKIAQQNVDDLQSQVRQLTHALDNAQELLQENEMKRKELQLKLTETQGLWEVAQLQIAHTRAREEAVVKLEQHLRHTVEEIFYSNFGDMDGNQQTSNGDHRVNKDEINVGCVLRQRLDAILERLSMLETLDFQLRQKGDAILILQDEKEELMEQNKKLQQTLCNFSSLFKSMPQSPAEVEQLLVERDVLVSILHRCERLSEIPNVKEARRHVELRKMELTARQANEQQQQQHPPQLHSPAERHAADSLASVTHNATRCYTTTGREELTYCLPGRSPSIMVEEE